MKSILFFFVSVNVFGWENHALPTAVAIAQMQEFSGMELVRAEALEDFLKSEQVELSKVLAQEELWAIEHVPNYPPRPSNLAFPEATFLQAIRVNQNIKLPLYIQELPGAKKNPNNSYWLPRDVSLLPNFLTKTGQSFVKVKQGQFISPEDVFISGTDEPDYGLDIGLWGKDGFGEQPFGNPKLEFSTQAPFHMGFYHEPRITYWAAGYLANTLPEYRIHLYYTLSRFAFATGHDYWGWRFAGWGAHYIQDLTQPYHSTPFPGGSLTWMLLAGVLDLCGIQGPKTNLVQEASDKHMMMEEQLYCAVLETLNGKKTPVWFALQQTGFENLRYEHEYVRKVLTLESHALSGHVEEEPTQLQLMRNFGKHTRAWVRSVILPPG